MKLSNGEWSCFSDQFIANCLLRCLISSINRKQEKQSPTGLLSSNLRLIKIPWGASRPRLKVGMFALRDRALFYEWWLLIDTSSTPTLQPMKGRITTTVIQSQTNGVLIMYWKQLFRRRTDGLDTSHMNGVCDSGCCELKIVYQKGVTLLNLPPCCAFKVTSQGLVI